MFLDGASLTPIFQIRNVTKMSLCQNSEVGVSKASRLTSGAKPGRLLTEQVRRDALLTNDLRPASPAGEH